MIHVAKISWPLKSGTNFRKKEETTQCCPILANEQAQSDKMHVKAEDR